MSKITHPPDETLLLLIDREVHGLKAFRLRRHLASCPDCRSRLSLLENTSSNVAALQTSRANAVEDSTARARAFLKARMQASLQQQPTPAAASPNVRRFVVALAAAIVGATMLYQFGAPRKPANTDANLKIITVPNKDLTPGATRKVDLAELCGNTGSDLDPEVSPSEEKIVLHEYGVDSAPAGAYQVDYLINPQLGGTDDIKNLWPEPYKSTEWNAHAKDALEVRLHEMVCYQQIDLGSAQRDLATDWIAAYKKYFHAAEPL
jgi:hypothetical protein